eukprot:SAG11_NODE_2182_length_3713_cov_8.308799_3_plen_315_part_01
MTIVCCRSPVAGCWSQRCDGVCRYFGAVEHGGGLYLVMKRYACSLDAHLHAAGPLSPACCLEFGSQLALGLSSLHAEQIIVKDLETPNVLLEHVGGGGAAGGVTRVVITDFGIAVLEEGTITTRMQFAGTPTYKAPEQFDEDDFGKVGYAADIWAFGCVLCAMLRGGSPWPRQMRDMEVMNAVLIKQQTPTAVKGTPDQVVQLVQGCLAIKQADRPTAVELLRGLRAAAEATAMESGASQAQITELCTQAAADKETIATLQAGLQTAEQANAELRQAAALATERQSAVEAANAQLHQAVADAEGRIAALQAALAA